MQEGRKGSNFDGRYSISGRNTRFNGIRSNEERSIHPSMHRQSMRNAHQPVITLKLGYKWTNQLLWVGMMMVMVQV